MLIGFFEEILEIDKTKSTYDYSSLVTSLFYSIDANFILLIALTMLMFQFC